MEWKNTCQIINKKANEHENLNVGFKDITCAEDIVSAFESFKGRNKYRAELKSKDNVRPSTAVRKHVKKISEEFTLTQSKFEKSVKSQNFGAKMDSQDKSGLLSPKIPQAFLNNAASCSKCESLSKLSLHSVLVSPIGSPDLNKPKLLEEFSQQNTLSALRNSYFGSHSDLSSPSKSSSRKPKSSPCYPRSAICVMKSRSRRMIHSAYTGLSGRSRKMSFDQLKKAKYITETAIKDGKVFSMLGYFPAIKEALKKRGWVEKVLNSTPYINPHPNNCVCSHVPWNHPSNQSVQSNGGLNAEEDEEVEEESSDGERDEGDEEGGLLTCSQDAKDSNMVTIIISRDGDVVKREEENCVKTSDGNRKVAECECEFNCEDNSCETDTATNLSSKSLCEQTASNDDIPPESFNVTKLVDPESNEIVYKYTLSDSFNTASLGPEEIRKGIAEIDPEKMASLYQYSIPSIEVKIRPTFEDAEREHENENTDKNEEEDDLGESLQKDFDEETYREQTFSNGKNKTRLSLNLDPPNPYPDLGYELTDADMPLVSRLVRNIEPNLIWTWTKETISFKHLSKDQLVNRYPNTPFTTKYGLCETLQQLHWFSEAAEVDTFVPRCYCIGHEDERSAFVQDYKTTACLNLLKYLTENYDPEKCSVIADPHGEISVKRIRQALMHMEQFIHECRHDDLDASIPTQMREHEWASLLTAHYKIIHQGRRIKAGPQLMQSLVEECHSALVRVAPIWPQLAMDGVRNVWIVKPGAQSRGRGIFLMNHLEEILALVQSPLIHETKYVVQKYIERPLLIYNTKFDIRQWFMVTDWNPLSVWMYRESYLRFCSQEFDLTNNNEAIHLSNNAIQCKYKVGGDRSPMLPDDNMWDSYRFQEYLRARGEGNAWDEKIYPGMRNALVATMLAAQVEMDSFKNGFEFYGADFMLTEDLRPWLIEINSSPCMAPTTRVTRRMCGQCLQDVVKVIVDYKNNKLSDTGQFELAYQESEKPIPNPPYLGVNLQVIGRQIQKAHLRQEKRKSKKAKPLIRVVKPLPLIRLSLGESRATLNNHNCSSYARLCISASDTNGAYDNCSGRKKVDNKNKENLVSPCSRKTV